MKYFPFLLKSFIPLLFLATACAPPAEREAEEKKTDHEAQTVHEQVLTLDSHVDTPLMLRREEFDISKRNDPYDGGGKLDFPRMEEGGLDAAFFAVFLGQGALNPEAYEEAKRRALEIFDHIHQAIEENPDMAGLALNPHDAYRLRDEGKRAIYIGVENGYPVGKDLENLHKFYDLGARYLGLSHSRNNQICDASTDASGPLHGGLSDFGVEVVKELNRMGMMVDVSHVSDEAFYQVLEITRAPIIASHSNVRAIADHPRNLDDDMIIALAENGGVLQLSVLSAYVKELEPSPEREKAFAALREEFNNFEDLTDEEMEEARRQWFTLNQKYPAPMATVADLVDHIDHVVELVGIEYVGIGTDFDGGGALKDCFDVSELENITLELVERGYTKEEIEKIWSGNFMRVFRKVEEIARNLQEL